MDEAVVQNGKSLAENSANLWEKIKNIFKPEFLSQLAIALGAILVLWLAYFSLKKIFKRIPDDKMKPRSKNIILTVLKYTFEVLLVIYVLNLFGINLNALFGAAGIAGLAIGLAAQTSLGNIISGFFLIQEHVFKVGNHIRVDGVEGNVESIGLLSVRIKTFDNQIVRIPNESMLKSNVENFSTMAERRICIYITVPNETNFTKVLPELTRTVQETDLVLKNPKSSVACADFADSGTSLRIISWAKYADFLDCKNNIIISLNAECARLGVKIQYPVIEITQDDSNGAKK
ncbi:MAG: mechanosensitive ion channel family protein [Treponemataceae bacterium]|nr:mechanosensitive ion channel family protein [Treponemataceae bacterium]